MKPQPILTLLSLTALLTGLPASAQDTRAFNQNASRSNHTRIRSAPLQNEIVFQASGGQAKTSQDNASGHFTPSATIGYFKSRIGATLEGGHLPTDPNFDLQNYTAGIRDFTSTALRPSKGAWYLAIGPVYRQPLPANLQLQAGIAGGIRKNSFAEFSVTDISSGQLIADYNNSQKEDIREKPFQLLIKPTIKLEWFPGNSFIGMHIYASGLINPTAQSVNVRYKDLSRVNYNTSQQEVRAQVMNAPFAAQTISTAKTTMSFGAGISLRLPTGRKTPRSAYQNNNTVRSNRGEMKSTLMLADTDGNGTYETDISQQITDEIEIDDCGKITPSQKAGVSTSRSNVRTRQSFREIGDGLYISEGTIELNGKEIPFQAIYKVRHDTVKNSINNVR